MKSLANGICNKSHNKARKKTRDASLEVVAGVGFALSEASIVEWVTKVSRGLDYKHDRSRVV